MAIVSHLFWGLQLKLNGIQSNTTFQTLAYTKDPIHAFILRAPQNLFIGIDYEINLLYWSTLNLMQTNVYTGKTHYITFMKRFMTLTKNSNIGIIKELK